MLVAADTESGLCCYSDCPAGQIDGRKECKEQPKRKSETDQ